MTPIDFDESNFTFTAPVGMTECGDLKVYKDDTQIISCWQMTAEEKIAALFFGRVWLYVTGQVQPPVSLAAAESIFRNKEEQNTDYDQVRREAIDAFIQRKAKQFMESDKGKEIELDDKCGMLYSEDLPGHFSDFLKFVLDIKFVALNEQKA